ncbi:MAG: hypothetical protein V4813_07945 [Gemmatimonadota bacterium]
MLPLLLATLALALPVAAPIAVAPPITPVGIGVSHDSLPRDPIAYHARLLRARALLAARNDAAAEAVFDSLTQEYALDHETWIGLATTRRRQQKLRASIDAYQHALQIGGPVPGNARYWIATAWAALGDTSRTLETLRQLVHDDHELDRPGLASDSAFAFLATDARFRQIVAPRMPAAATRSDGWRGDVDHLLSEIGRLSPDHRGKPLPNETRALALRLKASIPTLSDAEIFAQLSRIIATLHQGHTMMWGAGPPGTVAPSAMRFTYLPFQLHAFDEGLHVVATDASVRDLTGARLVRIGSTSADSAFARVAAVTSVGSATETLWTVPIRLSDVLLLRGLGIVRGDSIVARFALPSGAIVDRTLTPVSAPVRGKLPAPPTVTAPLFLRHVDQSHWAQPMQDGRTMYVQFNQVAGDADETLADFGLRMRRELAAPALRSVIVDLRHNNGGNTFTYRELLRTLIAFSAGDGHRVYVLIGRGVYSAAANFSTDLERLADPIFIGEPTSMTGNQHGDEGRVLLPYSGLQATIAGVKWQLSHPWDRRASIVPKVPVSSSARAWLAGEDPVLDTALRMAAAP